MKDKLIDDKDLDSTYHRFQLKGFKIQGRSWKDKEGNIYVEAGSKWGGKVIELDDKTKIRLFIKAGNYTTSNE